MDNGIDALRELFIRLDDNESVIRENSAYTLGELALQARNLSRNTLKSAEQLRKINALTDPALLSEATAVLVKALNDDDAWVRGNAADALGKIGAQEAITALERLISDNDKIVRFSAVSAIGDIDVLKGIDSIIHALNDPEWSVRLAAAKALERIPVEKAAATLRKTAKDKNPDVRDVSIAALSKLSA